MPAKYRKMGDFHQYYYGTKTAPYLTIFIGGNHEASNHLFELYYGGWVAPNIYYLGAANVVKLGSIKIAAMSGIFKQHDYYKPHYERLPYNDKTMRTIYHQRELDVRKLLAYRSQCDIGMSHDWPHEIAWLGDYRFLFKRKNFFLGDALNGELGSKAATLVQDRLRPSHWFSGHMHFKYTAVKDYESFDQSRIEQAKDEYRPHSSMIQVLERQERPKHDEAPGTNGEDNDPPPGKPADAAAVSGWHSFGNTVEAHDAEAFEREQEAKQEHEKQHGKRTIADYNFQETFKEVSIAQDGNAQNRQNLSSETKPAHQIPQLDGACFSIQKRRRKSSPSQAAQGVPASRPTDQSDGAIPQTTTVSNPDAIDINMSDSEDDNSIKPILQHKNTQAQQSTRVTNPDSINVDMSSSDEGEEGKTMLSQAKGMFDPKTDTFCRPSGRRLCPSNRESLSPAISSPKLAWMGEMHSRETMQASSATTSAGVSLSPDALSFLLPIPTLLQDVLT